VVDTIGSASQSQHPPEEARTISIILESDRLKVEIAEPGVFPNTTTRFDRAGFVTQVTLDGGHQFCTREPDNVPHPPTGGVRLCSEYRSGEPVLEAPMGAQFPKIGVGLLTKDLDGRYVHHHRYPCVPFPISFDAGKSVALFDTAPVECMGYAVHSTKKLEVTASELTMTMMVENVGRRPIAFTEYCHNFVTLDRLPIGPDYYLSMPVSNQDGKPAREGVALLARVMALALPATAMSRRSSSLTPVM
jgi:hypothetical protein